MRIDDASRLPDENEQANRTFVLPPIVAGELSVLHIEPEDVSLDAVLALLHHHERPVIIALPQQQSWGVFSHEEDFARAANTRIVSFVIPRERVAALGKFAHKYGFHFTSQLAKAVAAFFHRHNQYGSPIQLTSDDYSPLRSTPMQHHNSTKDVSKQQEGVPRGDSLQNTGDPGVWNTTPLAETHLPATSTPRRRPARKKHLLVIATVVILLTIGSAVLLPSLLAQSVAGSLTVPPLTATSVGLVSFANSGQLDPHSATGLNDSVSLRLTDLTPPPQGMSYYAWLEADKTQESIAPIFLGKLQVVGGKAQILYQEPQHINLLATYSRFLISVQNSAIIPTSPPLDQKTWKYQANIPDTPAPGDEKGYSLLSHMRHLLAKDPMLNHIGLQGGLEIWLYRNAGKILEWSNAARDDWAGNNTDLLRRQVDRVVQYLDGQVYAWRDLPANTPWLVDPKAGRPGLIDFKTTQVQQGPPSYTSHVRLHLTGMVHAPGHTASQEQLAGRIDDALGQITSLFQKVRSDAIQLAKMSDDRLKQPQALTLLNDMQMNALFAYIGHTSPTGTVQAGVVWVHDQMRALASLPVTTAGP